MEMERVVKQQAITISTTAAGSTAIDKNKLAAGSIGLQASTSLATITVWGSHDGSTFGPIYDRFGAAITIVVTTGSDPVFPELPDIIFKYPYLKLVDSGNEETATLFLLA